MITIKDIVELAKAGYKVNEVKELIELSKQEEAPKNESVPSDISVPEGASKTPESEDAPSTEPKDEEKKDYKALYEKATIELKEAQKANTKKDISSDEDNRSDEDIITDLIKEFM